MATGMGNEGRDSTTLSIVQIDLSTLATLQAPTYRVVKREVVDRASVTWRCSARLKALAEQWRPQHIVVDATGVGEGLWAMLDKAVPDARDTGEVHAAGEERDRLAVPEHDRDGAVSGPRAERTRCWMQYKMMQERDPAGAGEDAAVGRAGRDTRAGRPAGARRFRDGGCAGGEAGGAGVGGPQPDADRAGKDPLEEMSRIR